MLRAADSHLAEDCQRELLQLGGAAALQVMPDPRSPSIPCLACRMHPRCSHNSSKNTQRLDHPQMLLVHCAGMSPRCRASV